MNTFFVILFYVLSVAYAGIYSAKWPVNGEVPAKLSLRSGFGIQWIDSSSQYSSTPESALNESPYTKFQDLEKKSVRSPVNPLEESETQIGNEETMEIPASSATLSQRFEREDVDSSKYISIGSIYNESPKTKLEEQPQYKPKRVRSVTLVQETDSNVQNIDLEVPETPVSTSRTPNQAYYHREPKDNFKSSNLDYPLVPIHNYDGSSSFPAYLDTLQSTLPPVHRFPVQRNQINIPFYQSLAIAQNSPGFQHAAASTNSNGVVNGAGVSSVALSQNYGGVHSASSFANVDNSQSQAIAASLSDRNQKQNFAAASNQNGYGYDGRQFQYVALTSNKNGVGSVGNQFQNVALTSNQDGNVGSVYSVASSDNSVNLQASSAFYNGKH